MGRQKTLWIDEECWQKLEEMGDEPTSRKIRRAILMLDLDKEEEIRTLRARVNAQRAQIDLLKNELRKRKIDGWWNDDRR